MLKFELCSSTMSSANLVKINYTDDSIPNFHLPLTDLKLFECGQDEHVQNHEEKATKR